MEFAYGYLAHDDPLLRHLTLSKASTLSSDYSKLRISKLPREFLEDIFEVQNMDTLHDKPVWSYDICSFHSHKDQADRDVCKHLRAYWCKELGMAPFDRNSYCTRKRKFAATG